MIRCYERGIDFGQRTEVGLLVILGASVGSHRYHQQGRLFSVCEDTKDDLLDCSYR